MTSIRDASGIDREVESESAEAEDNEPPERETVFVADPEIELVDEDENEDRTQPSLRRRLHECKNFHFQHQLALFNSQSLSQNVSTDDIALSALNLRKNRYGNILPSGRTRVKIESNICNSDYINANFVSGGFIATQAPLLETIPAFWAMIWEQRVPFIVMLTRLVERGVRKADLYWPTEKGRTECYAGGKLRVTLVNEKVLAFIKIRYLVVEMKVVEGYSSHFVQHIQYLHWPDFGVPQSTTGISQILSRLNKFWNQEQRIVIHCSAGVGRSGTLITAIIIDWCLQRGKKLRELNLVAIIKRIRDDRQGMVQNENQFKFLYRLLEDRERYWSS